jgi:hypothetical protein
MVDGEATQGWRSINVIKSLSFLKVVWWTGNCTALSFKMRKKAKKKSSLQRFAFSLIIIFLLFKLKVRLSSGDFTWAWDFWLYGFGHLAAPDFALPRSWSLSDEWPLISISWKFNENACHFHPSRVHSRPSLLICARLRALCTKLDVLLRRRTCERQFHSGAHPGWYADRQSQRAWRRLFAAASCCQGFSHLNIVSTLYGKKNVSLLVKRHLGSRR